MPAGSRVRSVTRLLAGMAAVLGSPTLSAQEIPRDEYLDHLPLSLPRLVPATEASNDLSLFGDPDDPDYRDVAPVDGIDDGRHAVLLDLALRFAPNLVQNTTNFPTNFDTYIDNRSHFPLTVDRWDVTGEHAEFMESESINFPVLGQAECDPTDRPEVFQRFPQATEDPSVEDCKLLELMDRYTPGTGRTRLLDESLVRSRPSLFEVLYFNFPGEGEGSWEEAYEAEYQRTPEARQASFPHAYVHPFVTRMGEGEASTDSYELVLQYWFFYPTNDSGMDHEGDWEHLNVVISPRSMVEAGLSAETVRSILDGSWDAGRGAEDPLVIRRLEFYFHHFVMPLDFSRPNVYLSREVWEEQVRTLPEARFREQELWRYIRYLAYADDAETVINTHPLGYIGGDNKGLNQALEMPGGSNRDPHGTYPLPGRYNNVGPGGTTDHLPRHVDNRRVLRDLGDGTRSGGPTFEGGAVLELADPERLRIVPDWERVVALAREDAGVRRDWAWLLLPARWGYPATQSPFSGILENYNTGNVAPQGPSFNAGWNATGPAPGFSLYEPHTIPSLLPLQVQDNFRNDLGFLNLTVPVLLNLPPLDFVTRVVAYPFRVLVGNPDPVFYPAEGVPFRFVGLSSGLSHQRFDSDFNALVLNEQHFDQFVTSLFTHLSPADETTATTGTSEYFRSSNQAFFQVPFFIGGHFVSENTVRNVRASFGAEFNFNNLPNYDFSAELNYWEYAGSVRYNLSTSRVQPYIKGGYGWAWYRLENARATTGDFSPRRTDWIGPTSVLPNVWHYGLGLEFVPWKRIGTFAEGVDVGVRVEFARYVQNLGLDLDAIPLGNLALLFPTLGEVPDSERVHRHDFMLGFTISF